MEQQLAAGLGEGQVAEFVDDDEVDPGELVDEGAGATVAQLALQAVDEVDRVEEADPATAVHGVGADGDGEVALAGAGAADQDGVAGLIEERAIVRHRSEDDGERRRGDPSPSPR